MDIGRKIKKIRPMTAAEAAAEGWTLGRHDAATVIEFDDGSRIYASQDHEGNGPGALFGVDAQGSTVTVHAGRTS